MCIDRHRFPDLDVPRLGFRDFQFGHEVIWLNDLGKHRSRSDVLSNMQGHFHQDTIDFRAYFQRIELLLLQLGQRSHLIHFRLLFG